MTGKSAWRFLRPALLVGVPFVAVAASATMAPAKEPAPKSLPVPPPPVPPEAPIKLAAPPAASSRARAPAVAPSPPPAPAAVRPASTAEWMALPIDDLRSLAHGGDLRAMEELARRLVSGIGVPQDTQSGAGWLLRAAEGGSPAAAFNVGVMYERGFVVERDSAKAIEWYQKAADGNVAVAKHNLALLLRDGKGVPQDGKKAIELLRSAARQGMTASMFALGDIYERGDVAAKDAPLALAWFTVTVEFERQVNHEADSTLAKNAQQRVEMLRSVLTPPELERAKKVGQAEFQQIVAALASSKGLTPAPGIAAPAASSQHAPPLDEDQTIGWPKTEAERVRSVQQVLTDLRYLNGKADGIAGHATRAAIVAFEKDAHMRETGEASREVYVAALRMIAQQDTVLRSPLPPPPRTEPSRAETSAPARAATSIPSPSPQIDLGPPGSVPSPPTSADIARVTATTVQSQPDPDAWPAKRSEQIRAIQVMLGQLKLMRTGPTGELGPMTIAAIREYQRTAGLPQTGEPSRELFESLKTARPSPAGKPN